MLQTTVKHHTLGVSRAGNGSRLWLEGKRLANNGFSHGTLCARIWSHNCLILRPVDSATWETLERDSRTTIAGSVNRPIIDITGQDVARTFPSGHVAVTWSHNLITVTGV
jgi:hypothetical protein